MSDGIVVWGPGERRPNDPGKRNKWCIIRVPINGRDREKVLKGVTDPEEARSIAREYLGAAKEAPVEQQRGEVAGPATFGELVEAYIDDTGIRRKRQATFLMRLCRLKLPSCDNRRLSELSLDELRPRHAQQAANILYGADGCGTSKNRAVIGPFRAAVRHGARNELLPLMEVPGFAEVLRVTPRPDAGCLERLFGVLRTTRPDRCANARSRLDHHYRLLIVLYWTCQGWRIEESLHLTWDHVNLRAEEFQRFEVAKGRQVKDIDISTNIWEALAGLPEGEEERARAERNGRVFPWVNRHNVYRWLRPLCAAHGIKFTPHMARVEFASRLNEGGASPADTVAVGTWTDTRSVERYIRVNKKTRKRTIAMAEQAQDTTQPDVREIGPEHGTASVGK